MIETAEQVHVRQVAALIRANPDHFDMYVWADPIYDENGSVCGTAACIGGWSDLLAAGATASTAHWETIVGTSERMGLDAVTGRLLFISSMRCQSRMERRGCTPVEIAGHYAALLEQLANLHGDQDAQQILVQSFIDHWNKLAETETV